MTARERARSEMESEILRVARTHLGEVGPAALSLRAVARDLGLVSSAVYRYVASRDDLLTALIVQCYDELGAALEEADAAVERDDLRGRWRAACTRVRTWALAHPREHALLYGSPVPGYEAPASTIGPASRPTWVLVDVVAAAHADGTGVLPQRRALDPAGYRAVQPALDHLAEHRPGLTDPEVVARTVMAWAAVFGTVGFELFGHLVGSVGDPAAFFDGVVDRLADELGLP